MVVGGLVGRSQALFTTVGSSIFSVAASVVPTKFTDSEMRHRQEQ